MPSQGETALELDRRLSHRCRSIFFNCFLNCYFNKFLISFKDKETIESMLEGNKLNALAWSQDPATVDLTADRFLCNVLFLSFPPFPFYIFLFSFLYLYLFSFLISPSIRVLLITFPTFSFPLTSISQSSSFPSFSLIFSFRHPFLVNID